MPCVTFEDTIAAVQQGKADYGVVPVENSLYGRITDIYHLLPESGLFINGEHFLRIEMNLLGVKGATLKDVKSVQSLSVALGQCRKFIRKHKLKTINGVDTAGSAREIAERGDKSVAAIASRYAAAGLRPRYPRRGHRGRGAQHDALPRDLENAGDAKAGQGARSRPPSCSACATCRRRSTRRWAALPPTAST